MPNLPTVAVTQAQADRILVAFGVDQPSAVIAYKDWLTRSVRAYVLEHTAKALAASREASETAAFTAVLADLPPEPPIGGEV